MYFFSKLGSAAVTIRRYELRSFSWGVSMYRLSHKMLSFIIHSFISFFIGSYLIYILRISCAFLYLFLQKIYREMRKCYKFKSITLWQLLSEPANIQNNRSVGSNPRSLVEAKGITIWLRRILIKCVNDTTIIIA